MFPDDPQVQKVQAAMFDPFEYLMLRHKAGLLRTDFAQPLGKVSYHVPCHLRVQNLGLKTRDVLQLVPGTEVEPIERCSGHNGTYGVKKEYRDDLDEDRPAGVQQGAAGRSPTTTRATARWRGTRSSPGSARADGRRRIRSSCCASPTASDGADAAHDTTIDDTPTRAAEAAPEDLFSLEQYAKQRPQFRPQVLAHKKQPHAAGAARTRPGASRTG